MKVWNLLSSLFVLLFVSCSSDKPQGDVPKFPSGKGLSVEWKLDQNMFDDKDLYKQTITIKNNSDLTLPAEGWKIYFSAPPREIDQNFLPENVKLTAIQGDLYLVEPDSGFAPVKPNESFSFSFVMTWWIMKYSDAACGFYIVYNDDNGEEMKPQNITNVTHLPITEPKQYNRTKGDKLPLHTGKVLYDENALATTLNGDELCPVVPTPVMFKREGGSLTINSDVKVVYAGGLEAEANYLAEEIEKATGIKLDVTNESYDGPTISLELVDTEEYISKDEHSISCDEDDIVLAGVEPSGVFYAVQSFRQLIPVDAMAQKPVQEFNFPKVQLSDYPRFDYRGMHLDAARNFHSKESVLKFLDMMAYYKLNKFHFHFIDDEGWRIEIKGLPELTEVGSYRGHDLTETKCLQPAYGSGGDPDDPNNNGSGYYSTEDFIEILKFAKARYIEVIPELDMPGHARAAIKSMEARAKKLLDEGKEAEANEYRLIDPKDTSKYVSVQRYNDNVCNVCNPSLYKFLDKVLDELKAMYDAAGAKFTTVHAGADEVPEGVWEGSPMCSEMEAAGKEELTTMFLSKFSDLVSSKGLVFAGWEEIGLTKEDKKLIPNPVFKDKNFMPFVWNNVWGWGSEHIAYELANSGYKVVLANATNLYMDLAYSRNPEEPGYYWAGFCNTKLTYEFTPLYVYNSAKVGRLGETFEDGLYDGKTTLTSEGRSNILGLQGQLWSENIRGADTLEYFAYPKLLGIAERAWSKEPVWEQERNKAKRVAAFDKDWEVFANVVGQHQLPHLDYIEGGVNYRIPPVGISFDENDKVVANTIFPGLEIRYTNDGSVPTPESSLYEGPMDESKWMRFRAFSSTGRGSITNEK